VKETLIDDSTTMSGLSDITVRQTTTAPCGCKICGASSRYSYYGAIVCQPCKMFFRRNTGNKEVRLTMKICFYLFSFFCINLFRQNLNVNSVINVKST